MRTSDFWLTVTRAMLATLDLEQLLYVLLSGSTAGDGLNFNRAFLFLADDEGRQLRGKLAMGPSSQEEAYRIWGEIESQQFNLPQLMARYAVFRTDSEASALSQMVKRLSFSLPITGREKFDHLLARCLRQHSVLCNDTPVSVPDTELVLYDVAMVSLVADQQTIGVLVVDNAFNRRRVSMQELNVLATVANLAAIAVERARLHQRIQQLAEIDSLTGLFNRHAFDKRAPQIFRQAQREATPLCLLVVDIDHFKQCNDTYGHLVGDDILRKLGRTLRTDMGEKAVAARFGGDEAVVLLPKTELAEALERAELLRARFAAMRFGDFGDAQVTLTIGINAQRPEHETFHHMFMEADQLMYDAKQQGRNRVMSFG